MKLLIPISCFFGDPKSEIWQLDTTTGDTLVLTILPRIAENVIGKGISSLAWLNKTTLVGCDFNSVFTLDKTTYNILRRRLSPQYNDLHNLTVTNNIIYLANTGLDSIEMLDESLETIRRFNALPDEDIDNRLHGNYTTNGDYYDNTTSKLSFNQRKVPDSLHINHVMKHQNSIIATSFKQKCLIDGHSFKPLSNVFPEQPHDGFIHNDYIWVTTVSGRIYRAKLSLPFEFKMVLDLFDSGEYHGWCRGLFISGKKLFIGITAIQSQNERTQWLKVPANETKTGIYKVDYDSLAIENFYDFSDESGHRIFTILGEYT